MRIAYKILEENSSYLLSKKVEELVAGGWDIQGGVAFQKGNLHDWYCQAMVKIRP
jgi:hypothetical protein